MKTALAKFLYIQSVGADTSEFPVAGMKQKDRDELYKRRTGAAENYRPTNAEFIFLGVVPFVALLSSFVWIPILIWLMRG